ncbi:MAG: hypothetical protein KY463_14615 [Actinobacteria bacterium]|nr:hypothetical protein [Actinomycetota bacterium]
MRCLYVDLDSTLLGPGGALLLDADKQFTLEGVRALQACDRAGAEVVLMSGRRKATVAENARLFAQAAREELLALGDEIVQLDLDVGCPTSILALARSACARSSTMSAQTARSTMRRRRSARRRWPSRRARGACTSKPSGSARVRRRRRCRPRRST